jgi:type I restriction enzyme, S subunit
MSNFLNFNNWSTYSLTDLANYHNGFAFKPKDWTEDGVKIIRIEQLNKPNGGYDRYAGKYPSVNQISDGDLIFSWSATLKVVIWNHGSAVLNQHLFRVDEKDGFEKQYIYYILDHHMDSLAGGSHGSTMKHIKRGELQKYKVSIPSLRHQKKIAKILQTIDRTITHTEALIEKYQQIKAGLMHDLFTRGIGADGKLRPPRDKAPELYQDSSIGWIPKEWIFSTCSDVCEKVIDCKNRTPPITPDGYPVIRTPNVRNGSFIDNELVFTDYTSYLVWTARGKPEPGDIVITREAPVGEVCKIPERHEYSCLGQRMMLYRTDSTKIVNDYFLYALQSKPIQNRLDLISGGSTVGHVRVGDIRSLWIFYPGSRDEQLKIAESLNRISDKIQNEVHHLSKLKMQKSGLMHDLLTGTVQVNSDPV